MKVVGSVPVAVVLPSSGPAAVAALRWNAANDTGPAGRSSAAQPARSPIRSARERKAVDGAREAATVRPAEALAGAAPSRRSAFRGVACTVQRGEVEPVFGLALLHENPRLSIPLSTGTDAAAIAREWQSWAKALDLPLIAVEADGTVHAELTALGVVLAERPSPRRRGSPLVGRRSRYGRRRAARAVLRPEAERRTFSGEREITAQM